jgi:hypothetical protein
MQDITKITTETTITKLEPKIIRARVDTLRVGQRIAKHRTTTVTNTATTQER